MREQKSPEQPIQPDTTLGREDLTSVAREPTEDHSRAGWGSHYPGPVTPDENAPLMDVVESAGSAQREASDSVRSGEQVAGETPNRLANPTAADIRKDVHDTEEAADSGKAA